MARFLLLGLPKTGAAELVPEITAAWFAEHTCADDMPFLRDEMKVTSLVVVPMKVGQSLVGVLSLVMTDSGRKFAELDVPFAEKLARRVATSLDNARLHREVQALNVRLGASVAELSTIFQVAPVGLCVARDTRCRDVIINEPFRVLLGLPPE